MGYLCNSPSVSGCWERTGFPEKYWEGDPDDSKIPFLAGNYINYIEEEIIDFHGAGHFHFLKSSPNKIGWTGVAGEIVVECDSVDDAVTVADTVINQLPQISNPVAG